MVSGTRFSSSHAFANAMPAVTRAWRDRNVQVAATRTLPRGQLSLNYLEDYFGRERARELLIAAGLVDAGGEPVAIISAKDFWQLCVDNILATNDEAHGIARAPLPKLTFGSIYSGVNQMDRMIDGLKRFAESVEIVPADIRVRIGHGGGGIHVHFTMLRGGTASARCDRYLESVAMVFHCVMVWLTAEDISPIEVRTSALLREEDGSLLTCIPSPLVRDGQGVTIVYDRCVGQLPLGVRKYKVWAAQETEVFHQLLAVAGASDIRPAETTESLTRLLAERPFSQAEAARKLCISTATMKRRLAMEGTSFRSLSRDVRRRKLRMLLDAGEDLDDIAADIGLSDRRSLWRSCNDWLGMSPSAYRRTRFSPVAAE